MCVVRTLLNVDANGHVFTTQNLPFQNVKHETATIDPMPGLGEGGVLIQVTGFIIVR